MLPFLGIVIISESFGSAILSFSISCYRSMLKHLSWTPRLLKQVQLVYYQLLQISPFSVQLLRSQLLREGLAVDLLFVADCSQELHRHHNSEQCLVHLTRISCSSVRHIRDMSWIVVALQCLSKDRSFTS